MANYLNPWSGRQFVDSNGAPYVGAKLFTYASGSSTKVTTYKDSAGSSSHANPIILNARGEPADGAGASYPIWQAGGSAVKLVLAPANDTDPPVSAISTFDNISGINDTSVTIDQWIAGSTPTYVSATSLTLVGDQTSIYHVGRRIKTTNSGGTIYSTITVSAYTTLTTLTVINDSGSLDSGLSAVSYGIISYTNTSYPFSYALYRSGATTSISNSTTETTLFTYSIPADTLGTNHAIRLNSPIQAINTTGGAVNLTLRVKFGATTLITAVVSILNAAGGYRIDIKGLIFAKGATNAQVSRILFGVHSATTDGTAGVSQDTSATYESVAEDSTVSKDLVITAQWASASVNATAYCNNSIVEIL